MCVCVNLKTNKVMIEIHPKINPAASFDRRQRVFFTWQSTKNISPVNIKIPWIGSNSQFVTDKISLVVTGYFNSTIVFTIFTTRNVFSSFHKDVLPVLQQTLVVYWFKCSCETDHVSRTIQKPRGEKCMSRSNLHT